MMILQTARMRLPTLQRAGFNTVARAFSTSSHRFAQFVVVARDYTDADAPSRRLSIRPVHLERAAKATADGKVITGGAILDSHDKNKMVGSVMIFEMDSVEEVERYMQEDPYVKNKVWASWEILSFRPAPLTK
ncbi:hypothetical protein SpCBS45565_g06315 [Spizellomyces sp. 'palustris']|nr:hypothetical protein SpCBS45565_g06315 [Spizellomyces sp. 'palustris']